MTVSSHRSEFQEPNHFSGSLSSTLAAYGATEIRTVNTEDNMLMYGFIDFINMDPDMVDFHGAMVKNYVCETLTLT